MKRPRYSEDRRPLVARRCQYIDHWQVAEEVVRKRNQDRAHGVLGAGQ